MRFYRVTGTDGSDLYWLDIESAEANFQSTVDDVEFPSEMAEVTLAAVDVPIISDVVLRLLNGRSGYVDRERTLKRWTPERGNEEKTK